MSGEPHSRLAAVGAGLSTVAAGAALSRSFRSLFEYAEAAEAAAVKEELQRSLFEREPSAPGYRFRLERCWDPSGSTCVFVMLNPSTADDVVDDPTIRRCLGFAVRLGHGRLIVLNVYPCRATDPDALPAAIRAAPPLMAGENERVARLVFEGLSAADDVVAGWGAWFDRYRSGPPAGVSPLEVLRIAEAAGVRRVLCLRQTRSGAPAHPLYLPAALEPQIYWRADVDCSCDAGFVERAATPDEVDAGFELGVAFDLCRRCA